jgi:flagellar protein FliO/FliZ
MIQTALTAGAALAGIVLLILFAGRAAKATRFGRSQINGHMRVVESLALDTRRKLVMVSCDGRKLLLLTGTQDQVVGWLAEQPS